MLSPKVQVFGDSFLQNLHQLRLHVVEIIPNPQHNQLLLIYELAKPLPQLVAVIIIHRKDDLRPLDQLRIDRRYCIRIGPR
jgi:hypothetical protein